MADVEERCCVMCGGVGRQMHCAERAVETCHMVDPRTVNRTLAALKGRLFAIDYRSSAVALPSLSFCCPLFYFFVVFFRMKQARSLFACWFLAPTPLCCLLCDTSLADHLRCLTPGLWGGGMWGRAGSGKKSGSR